MRGCPGCPEKTPAISRWLARRVLARLPPETNPLDVTAHAVDWLTFAHPGFSIYLGRSDAPYQPEERLAVEGEVWRASQLPCPFAMPTGCALGGLCRVEEWSQDLHHGPWMFLPTALLAELNRPLLRDLVSHRLVADAKIARLLRRDQFPIVLPRAEGPYPATPVISPKKPEVKDGVLPTGLQSRTD